MTLRYKKKKSWLIIRNSTSPGDKVSKWNTIIAIIMGIWGIGETPKWLTKFKQTPTHYQRRKILTNLTVVGWMSSWDKGHKGNPEMTHITSFTTL